MIKEIGVKDFKGITGKRASVVVLDEFTSLPQSIAGTQKPNLMHFFGCKK